MDIGGRSGAYIIGRTLTGPSVSLYIGISLVNCHVECVSYHMWHDPINIVCQIVASSGLVVIIYTMHTRLCMPASSLRI